MRYSNSISSASFLTYASDASWPPKPKSPKKHGKSTSSLPQRCHCYLALPIFPNSHFPISPPLPPYSPNQCCPVRRPFNLSPVILFIRTQRPTSDMAQRMHPLREQMWAPIMRGLTLMISALASAFLFVISPPVTDEKPPVGPFGRFSF